MQQTPSQLTWKEVSDGLLVWCLCLGVAPFDCLDVHLTVAEDPKLRLLTDVL